MKWIPTVRLVIADQVENGEFIEGKLIAGPDDRRAAFNIVKKHVDPDLLRDWIGDGPYCPDELGGRLLETWRPLIEGEHARGKNGTA